MSEKETQLTQEQIKIFNDLAKETRILFVSSDEKSVLQAYNSITSSENVGAAVRDEDDMGVIELIHRAVFSKDRYGYDYFVFLDTKPSTLQVLDALEVDGIADLEVKKSVFPNSTEENLSFLKKDIQLVVIMGFGINCLDIEKPDIKVGGKEIPSFSLQFSKKDT